MFLREEGMKEIITEGKNLINKNSFLYFFIFLHREKFYDYFVLFLNYIIFIYVKLVLI
jgi:hypothetical protein